MPKAMHIGGSGKEKYRPAKKQAVDPMVQYLEAAEEREATRAAAAASAAAAERTAQRNHEAAMAAQCRQM